MHSAPSDFQLDMNENLKFVSFSLRFNLFGSLFSDLRSLAGTTLLSLLATLFMSQLLFVIGVGGIQVRYFGAKCSLIFYDQRQNDYSVQLTRFVYVFATGFRAMFVNIISAFVHEISFVVLDLLLLSSFINNLSQEHKHLPPARTEDGKSIRSLQVSEI